MIYFELQFGWGLILTNQDTWIHYSSKVHKYFQEPCYQVPRTNPEPVSLHSMYAYPYAIHTYSANNHDDDDTDIDREGGRGVASNNDTKMAV